MHHTRWQTSGPGEYAPPLGYQHRFVYRCTPTAAPRRRAAYPPSRQRLQFWGSMVLAEDLVQEIHLPRWGRASSRGDPPSRSVSPRRAAPPSLSPSASSSQSRSSSSSFPLPRPPSECYRANAQICFITPPPPQGGGCEGRVPRGPWRPLPNRPNRRRRRRKEEEEEEEEEEDMQNHLTPTLAGTPMYNCSLTLRFVRGPFGSRRYYARVKSNRSAA